MNTSQAFFNSQWISADELSISIFDSGFVLGATITEQMRTFGGKVFRLEQHLQRMSRSLDIAMLDPGYSQVKLAEIVERVVATNHPLLEEGDDLGVGLFVTPGPQQSMVGAGEFSPTVCVYSYPLLFGQWVEKYTRGQQVIVSDVRQYSPETLPPEMKCRSRMHYYLADQRAAKHSPGTRAILLDEAGNVAEASTANIVLFNSNEGFVSPLEERILPGISLLVVKELAASLGLGFVERTVKPSDLLRTDEIMLTSTSVCAIPVVGCDGKPVGQGKPGKAFQRLMKAWSELVGLDIIGQAKRFAHRK